MDPVTRSDQPIAPDPGEPHDLEPDDLKKSGLPEAARTESEWVRKIDAKGRVVLPQEVIDYLGESFVVYRRAQEQWETLLIPEKRFRELADKMIYQDPSGTPEEIRARSRFIYSRSESGEIGAGQRLNLSSSQGINRENKRLPTQVSIKIDSARGFVVVKAELT